MTIERFTISVQDEVLLDLQHRLENVRWPDEIDGAGWDYGANLNYMKTLVDYWRNKFDWRAQESKLNSYPNFKTTIEGQTIHFVRVRGKGSNPIPLIISHGWPGSFAELYKLIPLLTDPSSFGGREEDAFDVVIPSLPGFGFSGRPTKPGMTATQMGKLWGHLMSELGYTRFGIQGGDWGSAVSTALALEHPERTIGLHLNYIAGRFLLNGTINDDYADAQTQNHVRDLRTWWDAEGGYTHQQSTKPQTLSFGLNDSPVGLAAWIVDKFYAWSDCGGDLETVFSKDELLTNVMIYWITETINSSARIYYETKRHPLSLSPDNRVNAPVAVALFPHEVPMPPRGLAERGFNIVRWSEFPRGGHFAAMEQPELLADDIRAFFRPLR